MINVIFDMDGTLINSANAICEAVNEVRASLNLEPLQHKFITQTINTPGKDWAKILYDIDNFAHNSFKEGFEKYFIKHYQQSVVLFDGVLSVLEWLKSKDCYLAIATNAPQGSLGAVLQKHGIVSFFDKILGVSLGIEPKPHPMMLNLIRDEAKFGTSVFVGDSAKDKAAAHNAKMPFLQAKWFENAKDFSTNSNGYAKEFTRANADTNEFASKNSKHSANLTQSHAILNAQNSKNADTKEFASKNSNVYEFTNADELKNLLSGFMS